MLIQDNLPNKYINSINYIYEKYKNINIGGTNSIHYWINEIQDKELKYHLNRLRNAQEIKNTIKRNYQKYTIESSHNSDEIYLSVSPTDRVGSDITLSDCHYDAPFKYIYQGGCKFLRVILALNENKSVYTQVEDSTSILSTGDYNIIDYNADYHCVRGNINKKKNRILLKLHFIVIPPNTDKRWSIFSKYINDRWTHFSRNMMRDSIEPNNNIAYIKKYTVLSARFFWNNFYYFIITLIIIIQIIKITVN